MTNALMNSLLPEAIPNMPELQAGDTVRVHQRIKEGRNERIQVFQGVVIAMHGGNSAGATYTVRRTAAGGVGVERTFPLYSKNVEKVEVLRNAKVRTSPTVLPPRSPGQVGSPQGTSLHRELVLR